ncbi:MAG: App1 family protein [Deltaproteobacteria bacterium]|nr:App1 family protein [Deltaproteobacteria bacterium]
MAISPAEFAQRWVDRLAGPAAQTLSGRDGKLSPTEAGRWPQRLEGDPRLAGDNLADIFAGIRVRTPRLEVFLEAARAYAEAKAAEAADADGLLRDPARLDPKLRADFAAIVEIAPERPYTFSERILTSVMQEFGLADRAALLEEAKNHDNGNRRLTRAELTRAAVALTQGRTEPGIVSDLDKTIIPEHDEGLPPAAYAGVAALMRELELGRNGAAGDMYYVTARTPARVEGVPAWLDDHGLPGGPIATGTSTVPWVAQREKVKDITEIFRANPGQRFVLFGDTSHRDPEVYRQIQRDFPEQVHAVFIHKVNERVAPERVEGQRLIENYAVAAAQLYGLGLFTEAQARRVITAARQEGLDLDAAGVAELLERHRPA